MMVTKKLITLYNMNHHAKYSWRKSMTPKNLFFSLKKPDFATSTLTYDPPISPSRLINFYFLYSFSLQHYNEQRSVIHPDHWTVCQSFPKIAATNHVHKLHTPRVFHVKLLCAQTACLFHGQCPSLHHDLPQSPLIYCGDVQLLLVVFVSFSLALSCNLGSQRNDIPHKPSEQGFNEKKYRWSVLIAQLQVCFTRSGSWKAAHKTVRKSFSLPACLVALY